MVRKTRKVRKTTLHIPAPGPNQCHPRVGKETPEGGCFPTEVYEKAAKQLGVKGGGSKKEIAEKLAKHLGVNMTNQRTLLNTLPLTQIEKQEISQKWLRPARPEAWKDDPDMWLDSNNIRDVMKQYEESHPTFKFLGPYPIDFASSDPTSQKKDQCLIGEMCALDLDKEEIEGKKKIGIIYNLDPHYKNGSHWVANYIDLDKNVCYYFDSYGMKPPKQIYKFMQWLTIQEPKMKLGWNGRRFQMLNSECGMYCMYFIDRMIAGDSFLKFCRRAPPDRSMLDLRDWLFST